MGSGAMIPEPPPGFVLEGGGGGLDQRARDLAIRTIYGEAGNEPDEGKAAVAAVIKNRVQAGRYGGSDVPGVVLARNQFEPWGNAEAKARMTRLSSSSPEYQRIGSIVDQVFGGQLPDPTNGATHFFSPSAQAALGRNVPAWARGEGQAIGRHTFFAPEGRVTAQRTSAQQPPPPPGFELIAPSTAVEKRDLPPIGPGFQPPPDMGGYSPNQAILPDQSGPQRLVTDFENTGMGPAQGASPHPEQYGQPISTELHESDSGEILYKDPQTGQLVPTDQSKQVILKDPNDGRLKLYARSEATNEGALTGVGRLFARGFMAGAPTARAAIGAVRALKPGEEVVAAADRLSQAGGPVQVPRAVASDNMVTQQAGAVTSNVPFAGTPLVKSAERTIDQLGNKADEVAAGFGGGAAASVPQAGEAAKGGIVNWITGKSGENAKKLYDKVDELVDPNIATQVDSTTAAVSEILARRAASKTSGPGKAVEMVMGAVQSPEGLTYTGLKDLRTRVGEMVNGGILPEGMSAGELKRIYGALTDDLGRAVANAGGPEAKAAFDRANTYFRLASERRESLAKIVGAKGDVSPEQVMDRLVSMAGSSSRADVSKLAQARKAIGSDNWNEFVSGVITRLGRDVEGQFSPQRFITAYGKLSAEGKNILFRSTGRGDLADHLKDIAAVSSRFKELQKFANPSGTARSVLGGTIGGGALMDPLTTMTTVIGGRALAMALARPATAAGISRWARTYEALVTSPSAPRLAAFNMASRNLSSTLTQIGVEVKPADFLKALQSPTVGRADKDQEKVPGEPPQ